MTTQAQANLDRYTPEEYLALEPSAEGKSEYLDGDTVAMPGSSCVHNLIVTNLAVELRQQSMGRHET